ncbi:MAG TPA: glycosyltransferase family 39 protein [Thermoanaerobaculaceae bacterium]|nr:glycosyltransferase family 39 protein [Thermoanaerobaculaceae bacterium]
MSPARLTDLTASLAVVLAGVVLALTLPAVKPALDADEGVYLRYAEELEARGPAALPDLHTRFIHDRQLWESPPPTRSGYLLLATCWGWVFGISFAALAALSATCHLLTVASTYWLSRSHLGGGRAAALTWLVACSPLWLAVGRRVLTDAAALLAVTVALWTFLTWLREPARRGVRLGFVASLTAALLIKELSVLLAPVLLVVALIECRKRRRVADLPAVLGLLAVPGLLAAGIGVVAAGGPSPLLAVARIVLRSPASNTFAQAFCAGPWYRPLLDFLLLAPVTTLLGLATLTALWLRPGGRNVEPDGVAMTVLLTVTLLEFAPLIKNVRYTALLDLPLRFGAVAALWDVKARLPERWGRWVVLGGVGLLCGLDLVSFFELFVAGGIYDPTSFNLLAARQLIPFR